MHALWESRRHTESVISVAFIVTSFVEGFASVSVVIEINIFFGKVKKKLIRIEHKRGGVRWW